MVPRKKKRIRNLRIREASLVSSPANVGARVLLFKRADDIEDDEEELTMQTSSASELDRMLAYAKAVGGSAPHAWSDADIAEAMDELAAQLVPGERPERALFKCSGDPRMSLLYGLYKTAEAAPVEAPVAKAVDSKAWARIKRAVEAFRATPRGQHMSEPAALAAVLDQNPQLYSAYRAETVNRDMGD